MSDEWPLAALRSFALSLSSGRLFCARIWLCRQRIAARTSSRLSAAGSTSVFWQLIVCDVLAFGFFAFGCLAEAWAFLARLSPSAIFAITGLSFFLLLAAAAGAATSRPAMMGGALRQ